MSAVEDTRDVQAREQRLLREVASGLIYRTLRAEQPYIRKFLAEDSSLFPLDTAERRTMTELCDKGLVDHNWPGPAKLTDKGRAVLSGSPADTDTGLPAVPPLLCDGLHNPKPAVMLSVDSTNGLKKMAHCEDCAIHYAVQATQQAVARYRLDPSAPPAAVYFLPLPQAWTGGP